MRFIPLVKHCGWLLALALCTGGAVHAATPTTTAQVSTTFAASDVDFPNPERGFFKFGSDLSVIDDAFLSGTAAQGVRLVFVPNDLSAWRNQPLPATYLAALQNGFAQLRARGLKAVMRFAYNYPANETELLNAQDTGLAQVQMHITQLAPVLKANADVVAVWQAGFIGAWGEWHTSSNNLTTAANKLAVRDALLAALPAARQLQVRNPSDLMAWFSVPPTEANAFSATPSTASRMGLHNDCFLSSPDDVGTYAPPSAEGALRQYTKDATAITAFGGETCYVADVTQARMHCADILAEGAAYHLAYLNRDYYQPFFDNWQAEGCMAEVSRKIGYRMVLRSLSHSQTVRVGGNVALSLSIGNEGWARLANPRPLVLKLVPENAVNEAGAVVLALAGTDLRRIAAGAAAVTLSSSAVLPKSLPVGRYKVQLGAPDPAPTLSSQPTFALRFANADQATGAQWLATTGFMATGTVLTVK
jgi:Domain of unknown function (DUF4832)/Domain of unknown function (DUF4874)